MIISKNEGSRHDTLLTVHFERAIIITVRHDEPLTSQSATAGGYDNTFAVATHSCLYLIKNGAHYALYYISQRGFFSLLHFYFLLRKRELLAGHGRLSFVLYIYFSLKKWLTRTLMWMLFKYIFILAKKPIDKYLRRVYNMYIK